jgi:hypothetical protein
MPDLKSGFLSPATKRDQTHPRTSLGEQYWFSFVWLAYSQCLTQFGLCVAPSNAQEVLRCQTWPKKLAQLLLFGQCDPFGWFWIGFWVSQKIAKYLSIKAFVTSPDMHSNLNKHRRAVSVPRTPQYPGPQNHGYLEVPVYFNHLQTSLSNPYQSLALLLRRTYATHNRLLRDLRVSPDPYLLDIHSERPMMGSLSLGQEATPCKLCLWTDSAPQWQLPSFF